MSGTAPVVRLTVAFAAGVGSGLLGAPPWSAPLVLLLALAAPNRLSASHTQPWLFVAVAAGILSGATETAPRACEALNLGSFEATGFFETSPRSGAAPFRFSERCLSLTAAVPEAERLTAAGRPARVRGEVVAGRFRPWLRVRSIESIDGAGLRLDLGGGLLIARWREKVVERVYAVHGAQGGMVAALVLARREGLDHDLRDAFAAAGIAHLLAISGFHVGVIWGLVLALLRSVSWSRRRVEISAIVVVWLYVILIGVPDAATRAALILTTLAAGRAGNRPPTRWGGLAVAALLLLATDPSRLASAGFQLSFAGAAGLTAWSRPWAERWAAFVGPRVGPGLPRPLRDALVAGAAATLATLPIAAWHFERVSLVGIPVTLLATPLVTLALPSAILSLAVSLVSPGAAGFLAGGTGMLLDALAWLARRAGGLDGATTWIGQPAIIAGLLGVLIARWSARAPGVGAGGRRALTVAWTLSAVLAVPFWHQVRAWGTLELRMIDVGQGDALLVRSPAGRAILVDAGRPPEGDPRGHPVVQELRRAGIERLEWLVLTHADADHFGGAEAVLESVEVRRVTDPAIAVGKPLYLSLLNRAAGLDVPWTRARAGDRLDLDGVRISVLHPTREAVVDLEGVPGSPDANVGSVILRISWRSFVAVVTGDAYVDAERAVADQVGDVDVLKVGHHGSRTSTAPDFLERVRPEWALISAGRGNRYGHPAPEVLARISSSGARVLRTDQQGTVRLLVRRSGRIEVRAER